MGDRSEPAAASGRLVQIIFNPASGRYRPRRIAALRAAFERKGARVHLSPTDGTAVEVDPAADLICVAGGDGTVRQVAEGIRRTGRPRTIGIYPCGTINLLNREIGMGGAPAMLADRLLGRERRSHYGVALNGGLFLACASVGPETWAVERLSPSLKRRIGRLAYAMAFLPMLVRWPRTLIHVTVGGRSIGCEAFYVAKGRYFAGHWTLSPDADLRVPEMRLILLLTARRRDLARLWARLLLRRNLDGLPFVETIACTAFSASAAIPLAVQADGDIVTRLPATFSVDPIPLPFA